LVDSRHGGRVGYRHDGDAEFGRLPGEQARVSAAGRQPDHPEPARVTAHDVKRLGPD
jgi:hypothetical protein